ncbi:MAG: hypothetical protein FJ125_16050 [Deltaproteobacteria bacterium]|nr:hypothetical protein [Deltaproteobacteria bacterium]
MALEQSQSAVRSGSSGSQQQAARAGGKARLKKEAASLPYEEGMAKLSGAPEADGSLPPPPAPEKKDLPDPGVVKDATTQKEDPYAYKKNERGATLFGPNGVKASDVRQGSIADCYFAAAVCAVANANPGVIEKAIKDNADGTYTVTFYEVDYWNDTAKPHKETVDADLPWKADTDQPAYIKSTEMVEGKAWMELWPSILEKAYAQWKGSYDEIGHGGNSGEVMTALTGKRSKYQSTQGNVDALWEKMKKASADKKPMTAGTGDKDDERYKDPQAGVYGWHAYTVLGVSERKEGDEVKKFVTMRNPWAKRRRDTDAAAVGDKDNATAGGVFELTYDEFRRLYDDVSING